MKEIDVNSIVVIEEMAVIKQQLDKVSELIVDKTKDIDETLKKINELSFEEQEEQKQDIKKYRTYLNSLKTDLENRRKEIKKKINEPYEEFNSYYESTVLCNLNEGIDKLTITINSIEETQKQEKENTLREFYDEYAKKYMINDITKFEDIGLNITLTASEKSLKENIISFCERIANEIELIKNDDFKEEILIEYKNNGFDYSKAKLDIINKYKQIEEMKQKLEQQEEQKQVEEQVVEKVNEVIAPKEIVENDEILESTFTVKTTKDKLLKLIDFMKENEINYE